MRRILFIAAFLSALCCFSQVIDDFSDGDFVNEPVWRGDTDKFIVSKKEELRLNDLSGLGGIAALTTASSVIKDGNWEFYVHLLFNPSANNFAIFYLASSSADLLNTPKGYFVLIGGEEDKVALCRQDGDDYEVLIGGRLVMKGISSPQLNIKVACDEKGEWRLWTQLLGKEEEFVFEGKATDQTYSESNSIGLICVYTASRSKSFIFDNIKVVGKGEVPDNPDDSDDPDYPDPDTPDDPDIPVVHDSVPPKLLALYALSDTTVYIRYNEPVNTTGAKFSIDSFHSVKRKLLAEDKMQLTLFLSSPMENNKEYMVTMNGVKDISGNVMNMLSAGFIFYDTSMQTSKFGDVVFSEIMANPSGNLSLPEVEYIELYNRTNLPVNLDGWKFYYGNKPYKLSKTVINPEEYVFLCHEKYLGEWAKVSLYPAGMTTFPVLANSGKLLYLEDSRENLIAWVEYSDSWHEDVERKKGGYSLECIDTDNFSGEGINWCSCEDTRQGTPGEQNSVKEVIPDETVAAIEYFYFRLPDTLVIKFTKPMDLYTLSQQGNYFFPSLKENALFACPEYPSGRSVAIVLPFSLDEKKQEIELKGLKDISGYPLEGNLSFDLSAPRKAAPGEVFFNEILFNPYPEGKDYVELYNSSENYIPLNTLVFSSRKSDGTLTEKIPLAKDARIFLPHTYLCFTENPESLFSSYVSCRENVITISKLPSLPDKSGYIYLYSETDEMIDEMAYTEKMHTALLDDKEGISLEKSYPMLASSVSAHWHSASSGSGGGTPGCQNSQYHAPDETSENEFYLVEKTFSPDGDGINDELFIYYRFEGEDYSANCRVYDASGHEINVLFENYRLANEGQLVWNGQGKDGRVAPMGIYIIYMEIYNSSGKTKRFKLPCAITG